MKRRILTGDRPTGRLHLGHLVGSLLNRVKLQDEYDTIIIIADLHVLTTKPAPADIREIAENVRGLVLDYLASGLDPDEVTIYLQSAVPQVYELNTLFQNLVTVSRLSRVPSIKGMARDAHIDEQSLPYGLLGYPVPAGGRHPPAQGAPGPRRKGQRRACGGAEVEELEHRYRGGRVGDVEVKTRLAVALNRYLAPIRERMAHYGARAGLVEAILDDGIGRVEGIAQKTMRDVHDAMKLGETVKRIREVLGHRRAT
jgi:tryptophanyl-tRNA synthetase